MDNLVIFLAQYFIFIIGFLCLWVGYRSDKRVEYGLGLAIAIFIALDLAALAGALFYNPRPFVVSGVEPLFAHSQDNGFPSTHTILVTALAGVIYCYDRRAGFGALIGAVLVGSARVLAHVHSWTDIIGGLLLGAFAGYAGVQIARFLMSRLSAKRPKDHR